MKRNVLKPVAVGITVLCMLLAGCSAGVKENGNGKSDTSNKQTTTSTAQNTGGNKSGSAVLNWYYPGNSSQQDVALIEADADKYIKDKIGAEIKLNCFDWGTYDDRMFAMLSSGDIGDIVYTSDNNFSYGFNVSKDVFTDLTGKMDKYLPKTKEILGPKLLKGVEVKGKIYAVPTKGIHAYNHGLLLRKDLIEKYHFDLTKIQTLQDLEPMLKTIKDSEKDIYGLARSSSYESDFKIFGFERIIADIPLSIHTSYKNTTVVNEFETSDAKQFFKTLSKFYKNGYVDPSSHDDSPAGFNPLPCFAFIKTLSSYSAKEGKLGDYNYIQLRLGDPVMTGTNITGAMNAVPKSSKNPEKAMQFLELMNSDPYMNNLINFGIEGKHYVKKSENTIDYLPSSGGQKSGYRPESNWVFGNSFINYLLANEDPKKWEKMSQYNDSAKVSPLLGFVFDMEPVQKEVSAVKNIYRKHLEEFMSYSVDPDTRFPGIVKELKDAGINKIKAEMQKQIDAFINKK